MSTRDFYTPSAPAPLDQADGLRRLFAPTRTRFVPLVANPHVPHAGPLLDHVALALVARGQKVLVVDAADGAPAPHEMAMLDMGATREVEALLVDQGKGHQRVRSGEARTIQDIEHNWPGKNSLFCLPPHNPRPPQRCHNRSLAILCH